MHLYESGVQSGQIQMGVHLSAPFDEDQSITCSNMDTNGGRILAYVRGASLDQIFGVKENTRECERGSGDWAPHSIEVSCGWEISVYADEQCADSNPSRFSGTAVELSEAYSSLSSLYFRVARRSSPDRSDRSQIRPGKIVSPAASRDGNWAIPSVHFRLISVVP